MTRILLLDEAREDLRELDGSARKIVAKGIEKLRIHPSQRGAPLGSRPGANLTGLRKLVVGNRDYRIVYDVREDDTIVVIWVIGPRADEEAYRMALARIDTYAGDTHKEAILRQMLDTAFGT